MTPDDAKALVSEYIERVWNNADFVALGDLCGPSYSYRLGGQPPRDKVDMKQFVQAIHAAFPDWNAHVQAIVAAGNAVVVQWKGRVTHRGAFHGLPPIGKQIYVCGINLYSIRAGKIDQESDQMDSLGMLQQLGALPASVWRS
jgi:steroid delta-isomerase-like uncharacterized protein